MLGPATAFGFQLVCVVALPGFKARVVPGTLRRSNDANGCAGDFYDARANAYWQPIWFACE